MKSKFYFFAAMAMMMATGCAKTFNSDNPIHGDKDEIRFSSYVNVMTKSGTKATETFDNGEGFVVIGGWNFELEKNHDRLPEVSSIASALTAADTFNATQVYNEGTAESPIWVPKEISSETLASAFETFITQEIISEEVLNNIVADCFNSNFKASWFLASMLLVNMESSAAFEELKKMEWSPVHKYWNYNADCDYRFTAYSPASIINDAGLVGCYKFGYAGVASINDLYLGGDLDIMYATADISKSDFGKDVELVFKHLGSKLEFNIKNACAGEIKIHAAALGGTISKLAKINMNKLLPDTEPDQDEVKNHYYIPYITEDMASAMESEYTLDPGYIKDSGFDVSSAPYTISAGDSMTSPIVVCPQIVDTDNNTVLLAYTLGDDTNMYMAQIPLSEFKFDGEELTQWGGGYKYTYKITVNHDEISFKASVADWVDGGEGTVVLK